MMIQVPNCIYLFYYKICKTLLFLYFYTIDRSASPPMSPNKEDRDQFFIDSDEQGKIQLFI